MQLPNNENPYLIGVSIFFGCFFLFNLIVRKSLSFRGYFTSRYNLLTSKVRSEKTFDVPKDLMFEKVKEVIESSNFKLVAFNKETFEILAISKFSFQSWGENLYIRFQSEGENTIMEFCSTTLFQIYSWGKNEKNYADLMSEIEGSFTI
jgi:hypothetical protein